MKTKRFIKESEISAPVEEVFAFHEQPGAIDALIPAWERVEIIERSQGIQVGTRTVMRMFAGPFSRLWVAEHTEYIPNRLFADVQRKGPFAYWYHKHRFEPTERNTTIMIDDIEYALPLGWLGELIGGRLIRARLQRMFDYRHLVVAEKMKGRRD